MNPWVNFRTGLRLSRPLPVGHSSLIPISVHLSLKKNITNTNSSLNEEYRNSPVNIIRYVPEDVLINSCIGLIGSSVTYAVVLNPSQGLVDAVAAFAASSCRVLSVAVVITSRPARIGRWISTAPRYEHLGLLVTLMLARSVSR